MKKSKFLKSSKDLLSRSFNPSKCKTSLKLAASRLKLLRNKKEAQVKQIRREISVLLESGQDQTARIRVEHVIREEKMMAAFDLIGIYCELIVARLPVIETQKICPIDLKEAIASVVYASPRCGDVPELVEVKKHFTEKYGKDFVAAAIELRPECGVSRMLVEKLSALAPDVETKTKILSAIAREHNVEWEAKSFEQSSIAATDLLSRPTTFVKEPSLHDSTMNFPRERLVPDQVSSFNSGGERARFYRGDGDDAVAPDRRRWNMDFKDATSAAQAAAESAELASIAARAAAELSSRGSFTRQCSTESHKSDDRSPRGGKLVSEQFSQHSRLQNEHHSPSLKSRASTDDGSMERVGDRYSPRNEVYRGERGQSFKSRAEKGRDEGKYVEASRGSAVVFDRSDSDAESYGHDSSPTYDEPQQRPPPSDLPERSMRGSTLDEPTIVASYEFDVKYSEFKDKSRPQYDQTQLSLSSDYESEESDKEFNVPVKPSLDQPKNRNDIGKSSPEREEGLNFARLTGGFRHKGYNYPSFGKNNQSETSSLEPKNTKADLPSTSDTDSSDSEEEHKLYNLKTRPSFAPSNSVSTRDSDQDQPVARTSRLRSGISRRTKAVPSNHEHEKHFRSEALDQPLKGSAYNVPSSSRVSLHRHSSEKAESGTMQESRLSAKLPRTKTEPIDVMNKTSSNKDLRSPRASHVHPKLPDYDNFVQFFQKNRA